MADAYNELLTKYKKLETRVINDGLNIDKLEKTVSILARKSDVENEAKRLRGEIAQISSVITESNDRLNKVLLPNETKYYLDENELLNIRNKIRQMNSIMVRLQSLEKTVTQSLNRLNQKLSDVPSTV